MQQLFRFVGLIGFVLLINNVETNSITATQIPTEEVANTKHNWQEYSTDYDTIEVGTHEYTYWKNFIRHRKTCHISHQIKTVVYYCDVHDHTRSETFLEEILHSEKHRE